MKTPSDPTRCQKLDQEVQVLFEVNDQIQSHVNCLPYGQSLAIKLDLILLFTVVSLSRGKHNYSRHFDNCHKRYGCSM